KTLARMVPAHQGLQRIGGVRREQHDRLVVQNQLALCHRPPQVAGEARLTQGLPLVLRRVNSKAAAGLFGDVHGNVGAAQRRARVVTVYRIHRDADRRAGLDSVIADREGTFERREYLSRGRDHVVGMLGVGADDRELVTAESRDGVGRPQHALQPRSDFLQQRVATVVPERVVDVLEPIEVEQQDAEHRLVASCAAQPNCRLTAWLIESIMPAESRVTSPSDTLSSTERMRFSLSCRATSARFRSTNSPICEPMSFITPSRPSSSSRGAQVASEIMPTTRRPLRTGNPTRPWSPTANAAAERGDGSLARSVSDTGRRSSQT